MNSGTDILNLLETVRKYWHRPWVIIPAFAVIMVLASTASRFIFQDTTIAACTFLAGIYGVSLLWLTTNCLPRTKKGKVGFVVSIYADEEAEYNTLKHDFVYTLRGLLAHGTSGQQFQFIDMPQHVAEKVVDGESVARLQKITRAHFVLTGRIRLRKIGGEERHILDLQGLVMHAPVPKPVSETVAREFRELLPSHMQLPKENDVVNFAFTSDWINCVARYIIGIAAAVSGDFAYAESLQIDVRRLLEQLPKNVPPFEKLAIRVPRRLGEIYYAQAIRHYRQWVETRQQQEMEQAGIYLGKIPESCASDYGVLLLSAIHEFVINRNVDSAINIIRGCKGAKNTVWLCSLAFLHAYKGDLSKSASYYWQAVDGEIPARSLAEIEEFIIWVLNKEPEEYQLYFCLGFLNWKAKGDLEQAKLDLETFLKSGNEQEFSIGRKMAKKWLKKIETSKS